MAQLSKTSSTSGSREPWQNVRERPGAPWSVPEASRTLYLSIQRAPGTLQDTLVIDQTLPDSLQNIIFVGPGLLASPSGFKGSGKVLGKLRTSWTALSRNFRLPRGISQWPPGSLGRLQEGSQTFFLMLHKSNIILVSIWEVTRTSQCHYPNTIPPTTGQHHHQS